jgi:hypothetical protein
VKTITQTKFWQLSTSLKLVVVWFFLLGMNNFWQAGNYFFVKQTLSLVPLIRGIIEWNLAIGLINRINESRNWAVICVILSLFFYIFLLSIAIFRDPASIEGFNINYEVFTHTQTIIFLSALLTLSVVILFALVRPTTKTFFAQQTNPEDNQ